MALAVPLAYYIIEKEFPSVKPREEDLKNHKKFGVTFGLSTWAATAVLWPQCGVLLLSDVLLLSTLCSCLRGP